MKIQTLNTMSELTQLLVKPITEYAKRFAKGQTRTSGAKVKVLSQAYRSDEMTEISLPEFVAIKDFIDKLITFSNITLTRVRLIRIEVKKPKWM